VAEYYKLVSENHERFDAQFAGFGAEGDENSILRDVQSCLAARGDQELVWTPIMDDDGDTITLDREAEWESGHPLKSRTALIVQVVHGRVSIDPMPIVEQDGEYFVDVEAIG
jgi:hypothetical protein